MIRLRDYLSWLVIITYSEFLTFDLYQLVTVQQFRTSSEKVSWLFPDSSAAAVNRYTVAGMYRYTPCYCEENIWHLAREDCFRGRETIAAIISGKGPYRKLWYQRNAENPESPVYWDYHVILLSNNNGWYVWDLDTTLGLKVPAETYFRKTFLQSSLDAEQTDVILRLMPAEDYIQNFSSDRSHMRLPSGAWAAPPPKWPIILNQEKSNLLDWLDINQKKPGQVLTLDKFMRDFLGHRSTNESGNTTIVSSATAFNARKIKQL